MTTSRSISFTDKGIKAIEFLKENSINVSNYIEKLLLNAVAEDFSVNMRGIKEDV
ncbi:MAG: hypothetical protein IJS47_04900 [Clostridia bacterium]|nr:hypothetical protein [Clostridia bacterium]